MPELPDITAYLEALQKRVVDQRLRTVRLLSPFFLRSVEPAVKSLEGRNVLGIRVEKQDGAQFWLMVMNKRKKKSRQFILQVMKFLPPVVLIVLTPKALPSLMLDFQYLQVDLL